ncbi:MAG: hypothetical protein KAV42_01160 [Candidatus Krumholzibacteria bacterium]|nr:hypothetical protein [Candidatus Krumholzibacteria bacterium]
MGTRKRLEKREHIESGITAKQVQYLRDRDLMTGGKIPFDNNDHLIEMWRKYRDRVIAEHTADRPGTRPWAFWRYDAEEPRRLQSGDEIEIEGNWRHQYGWPAAGRIAEIKFETQAQYLDRLELLSVDERKALETAERG